MRTLLEWQLKRIARNISLQDRMIKRELLIGYMTQRELDWACFRRGLNPQHKQRLEQESFLRDWIRYDLFLAIITAHSPLYDSC